MFLIKFFVITMIYGFTGAQETANEYVRRIFSESAKAYITPTTTNAGQYRPANDKVSDGGEFDFIIVGAGSTGAVMANRLSESVASILVLEAGEFGDNFTEIPAMSGISFLNDYSWQYRTTKMGENCQGFQGDTCPYPSGRGVGGGSLINNMIYSRGNKIDYGNWASSCPEWSFEKVFPYFLKSEDFLKNIEDVVVDENSHKTGGPLHVEYSNFRSFVSSYFMEALEEYGLKKTDINGPDDLGYTPMPLTIKNGRRVDTGTAFVKRILDRSNLKVLTKAYVLKVLIDPETKTAYGVRYSQSGRLFEARAQKEVILSAGAINSPRLLMLSGVGPRDHLESFNIEVIEDLEVGNSFRDHSLITVPVSINKSIILKSWNTYVEEYLNGTGAMTNAGPSETIAFFSTGSGNSPNLEIFSSPIGENVLVPNSLNFMYKYDFINLPSIASLDPSRTFFLLVAADFHIKSTGAIRLQSNDPYDYPLINPNILSHPDDIESLLKAMDIIDDLLTTNSFKEIDAQNHFYNAVPLRCLLFKKGSRKMKECLLRTFGLASFHPISSCKMGQSPEDRSVVDQTGKVHNIQNLRVVDASIIPVPLSGHSNAICIMIGERISDIIKTEHGLQ